MGNKYVGIVHPCKIYNVLAANRAFLYIGPRESHVQDIIHDAGPVAYASAHGDVDGVVANILLAMRQQEIAPLTTVELARRFAKESLVPQMIRVIEESKTVSSRTRLEPVS
jgi:hypothetical protein